MPKFPFTRSHRLTDPGYAVSVPASWRQISDVSRVWFYALAVKEIGHPIAFTVRLLRSSELSLRESPLAAKDFLMGRFRDHIPGVPFFYVIEFSRTNDLHLHGAASIADISHARFCAGLRKVAGDVRKVDGLAARYVANCRAVCTAVPDYSLEHGGRNGIFGWATYCAKDVSATTARLGNSPISCSRSVLSRARAIHSEIVAECAGVA